VSGRTRVRSGGTLERSPTRRSGGGSGNVFRPVEFTLVWNIPGLVRVLGTAETPRVDADRIRRYA